MNDGLKAQGLHHRFRGRPVLNDVHLIVRPGEVVGLLGPNGAGKTTCFRILWGALRPLSGRVWLGERDLTRVPAHLRARAGLGYLPQEPSVFRELTVQQNLHAVLELQDGLSKAERIETSERLLEESRLTHLASRAAGTLSGGERRRVEIARCLACRPRILLLDEPFAGVEPRALDSLMEAVTGLGDRGIGVLLADHNLRETLRICGRSCVLLDGRVAVDGPPEVVLADPAVRSGYLGPGFRL